MKKLYEFTINKETDVETQVETKNDAGETIITKKKEKQSVPYKFFIAKPTRNLADQCALYNSVEVAKGLKNGLLSVFSLDKKYREEGVFTEEDNKNYKELCENLIKLVEEFQVINKTPEDQQTEKDKQRIKELTSETSKIQIKLKDYEQIKSNLYIHSAEFRARNLTITWWALYLSYKNENDKEVPFFTGNSLEEKLKYYDELVEKEDSFIDETVERFLYAISFWIINNANKQEDFKELEKYVNLEKGQ